jgi:DNA-binding transcriptional MerR regulator/methylmalonyl-CoA mutase cobalamin-binding subunit
MSNSRQRPGQPQAATDSHFPIRTVANLTGINPVTLRAWERRYKLITPQRTAKGHRLYSQMDIERIQRVLALLDQGISISQVSRMLDQEPDQLTALSSTESVDVWEQYLERMLAAIRRFDEPALEGIYNDALSLYPADLVNTRLTTPLLRRFGDHWKEQSTLIAEEHFFSVYLRNKLGARLHHMNQRNSGRLLLLACLPGELHEIGMLFFALAAVNRGYRVLLLGANMPLEHLPEVIRRRPCEAIVLSGSARPGRNLLQESLPELVKRASVPVLVGGGITERHASAVEAAGAICIGKDIQPALQQLGEILTAAAQELGKV